MQQIFGNSSQSQENEWISFSDLMAVLMVMFLFIAIIYFNQAKINTETIESENQKLLEQEELLKLKLETIELRTSTARQRLQEVQIFLEKAEQSVREAEEKTEQAIRLREKAELDKIKAEQSVREAKEKTEQAIRLSEKAELDKIKIVEEARLAIQEATERQAEILDRQRDVTENFVNFELIQQKIFAALKNEFQNDLERWGAELIREDLVIRFLAPDVLFEKGSSKLTKKFKEIIAEFTPRYVGVLKEFQLSIDEIRIEGHTSSAHRSCEKGLGKYLCNLELSQNRAREVAGYSLNQLNKNDEIWLRKFLTSNGLSSSKLVRMANGSEDRDRSRRVEFKVRTSVGQTFDALRNLVDEN